MKPVKRLISTVRLSLSWLFLFPSLAAAVATRWFVIGSPWAPGWDGYYYLEQTASLLEKGHLHSFELSLVYPLLAGLKLLTGDYVSALQTLVILTGVLMAFAVFLFVRSAGMGRRLAGAASFIAAVSAFGIYAGIQYPKNMLGIVFFVFFAAFLNRRVWIAAAVFFLLALATHKQSGLFALCFYIVTMVPESVRSARKIALVALVGIIAVPVILSLGDFSRLGSSFLTGPFLGAWGFAESIRHGSLLWKAEALVFTGMIGAALVACVIRRKRLFRYGPLLLILLPGMIPFADMSTGSVFFRFFVASMLLAPLLYALMRRRMGFIGYGAVLVLFITIAIVRGSTPVAATAPDYEPLEKVADRYAGEAAFRNASLIITHKPLAEYLGFRERRDVMAWRPDAGTDRAGVMRLAKGVQKSEYAFYLGDTAEGFVYYGEYALLPESAWEELLRKAEAASDTYLLGVIRSKDNPHVPRPAYIHDRKKGLLRILR